VSQNVQLHHPTQQRRSGGEQAIEGQRGSLKIFQQCSPYKALNGNPFNRHVIFIFIFRLHLVFM
jgi:hypothetical protein